MKRFFILIITGFLVVALTSFMWIFQTEVTVTADIPDVIDAGTEIIINVTVRKGAVRGFARYQQELPVGFTASSDNSANAAFNFQDQKVQLIWLSLPAHNEISFSYKIIANERLTGSIDLGGQFSFIADNAARSVETIPTLLSINPSPNVSPELQVDVNDFAKIASIEAAAMGSGQTVAFRQRPVWLEEDRVFLVTLLINKDAAQTYAKIEETVPEGFVATGLDTKSGIFEFRNQKATIIWMTLPLEPYFTVSYKLIPVDGTSDHTFDISGLFSFLVRERTFETEIVQRNESLAGLSREQVNRMLQNMHIQTTEQQPLLVATTPTTPPPATQQQTGTTATPPRTTPPTAATAAATAASEQAYMFVPQQGIYYRVQISAGRRLVNVPREFRNYRLEHDVSWERHEGWYKYTTNSFSEYRDARDYRVHISNTTTINDAFVVAYNNERRITVQDALMALNQRWVR